MLKLLVLYISGLGLTWIALCSILFGFSHWRFAGSLMPLLAGLMVLLLAARLLLATVRIYIPPKKKSASDLGI